VNNIETRAMIAGHLLKKVREDKYPSATEMAIIEEVIPPELLPRYVEILMEKVMQENRPSISMLHRIRRLADSIE
jgi:nucleoside-triphosphatase THEP1